MIQRLLAKDFERLTPRQRDVYRLCLTGISVRSIAVTLFIDQKTVKFHITAINKALGMRTRLEMLARALRMIDEVDPEEGEAHARQALEDAMRRYVDSVRRIEARQSLTTRIAALAKGNV